MAKLTLTDLTSLANDTSAVNTINANMALIETAMDTALFRTGAAPNSMSADLDMGSNYVVNVKSPNNSTDGANKAYVDSLLSGTTDTGSAQLRIDIASTANTEGASLVGVEDSASNFTGANVETVLAEIDDRIDTVITDTASTANTKGASLVGVEDAAAAFTGADVEAVTNELFDKSRYMQYAYLVSSGTDTYTATPSPALTAYATGETYRVSFGNANTSVAPTLDLNGIGPKTVKGISGGALAVGALDGEHLVSYNGTDMILLNPVNSSVVAVSGWTSSTAIYLDDDNFVSVSFDIDAVIGSTFESVGPTGSSATNIWTGMDVLPATAKAVLIRFSTDVTGSTTGQTYNAYISGRKTGTTGTTGNNVRCQTMFTNHSGLAERGQDHVQAWIPIDSSLRIDLAYNISGTTPTDVAAMHLIGFST